MHMMQRPVADLRIEGNGTLVYNLVKKERPQYSCNFMKCVKALRASGRKSRKKICAGD